MIENLLPVLYLCFFLVFGIIIGRIIPKRIPIHACTLGTLYFLLFFMGFRLGNLNIKLTEIGKMGFHSLLFAFMTITGTILVVSLLLTAFGSLNRENKSQSREKLSLLQAILFLLEPLLLIFIVVSGTITGFFISLPETFDIGNVTMWLVYILVLLFGVDFTRKDLKIRNVLMKKESILIPVGTIIGSLLGGYILSFFIGISPGKALAVSAGFGWYSLSGILITDLGDPLLGSLAFLSNLMREALALIIIPIIGKSILYKTGIGIGGATSMDVTLPLIERYCSTELVPIAILNGIILSAAVPVLVPFFMSLSF